MNVYKFHDRNIKYGQRIVLIASTDIRRARKLLPGTDRKMFPIRYNEGEKMPKLKWHGKEQIIEDFYWEE